jgi:hypothetical protein
MTDVTRASGQTPYGDLFPPLPQGFNEPFWYASLQSFWMYWQADADAVTAIFDGLGTEDRLRPAIFDFGAAGEGALLSLDLQRYTGHGTSYLETTLEVEFNLYAYPTSRIPEVPALTLDQFLLGEDQTRSIGGYRQHVPCSNPNAIAAGKGLFGEPKYLAVFDYNVPSINDPTVTTWDYSVYQAEGTDPYNPTQGPLMWSFTADVSPFTAVPGNQSPLVEYGVLKDQNGEPRVVANSWDFYGPFQTYLFDTGSAPEFTLTTGASEPTGTVDDIVKLVKGNPVAAQIFTSAPVSCENRGWFTVPAGS